MKRLLLVLAIIFMANIAVLADEDREIYKIGIKDSGPFAQKIDGEWEGVSIELIKSLSEELGFDYEFVEVPTITALLSLSEFGSTDLAIGAISMTQERERMMDFSHPYFTTTPGMLTLDNGSIWNTIMFVAQPISAGIAALLIALYTLGFIVMRLDPNDQIDNVHKGAWFVLTTFTTTGYGDLVPENARAKVFAGFLQILSAFTLSIFTAYVASAWTVERLSNEITTLADVTDKKVVAVGGSTTSNLLNLLQIRHDAVTTPSKGVSMVESGKAKAFVYDKAMLDYIALHSEKALAVHPIERGRERYAITFPPGSQLRESFNVAILKIIDTPEWNGMLAQYFGN